MARTIETPIQKRFSDIDSFCHVNNVAQQMYFDLGKTDYYHRLLSDAVLVGDGVRIVTASTATSYLGQIRFEDEVTVRTTCERVGTKSLTLLQQLCVGDEVRTESRSVMVAFDFTLQQSVPVPAAWLPQLLGE